ncbi:hypothetical protein LCM08_20825 [Salipiger pacificus]|nr:hypothetical protein [Alloyangia pacifica]
MRKLFRTFRRAVDLRPMAALRARAAEMDRLADEQLAEARRRRNTQAIGRALEAKKAARREMLRVGA